MDSVSLYGEARNEYLKQLSTWICGPIVEFFRKEYSACITRAGKRCMAEFQEYCSTVPRWNQDVIDTNVGVLLDNCRCDYVEELMTAVFIAHTKMLTAIRVNGKQKKLQITLPKLDHFLHRVFTECARAFWKAPFLFAEDNSPVERQKNLLQAESMAVEALSAGVRSLLPIKNILRDYLENDDEGETVPETMADTEEEKTEDITAGEPIVSTPVVAPIVVPPIVSEDAPIVSEVVPTVVAPTVVAPTEVAPTVVAPTEVASIAPVVASIAPVINDSVIPTPVIIEKPTLVIEKMLTTPEITEPPPSNHMVETAPVSTTSNIEKLEAPTVQIDTERAVHFTPYDTVFNTNGDSKIEYVEKVSVEEKNPWDEDVPRLTIGSASSNINTSDIVDLEPPADIDAPLTNTGDFETLV